MTGLERVKDIVGDVPHMTWQQAQALDRIIRESGSRDILELGFRHGVSTCYMASTLEALNAGHITTIDLKLVEGISPSIDELLKKTGLAHRVTRYFEPTSYTWRLMRMLEESPEPRFDLCYLDGAHSWFVDGFAFFLVDRLLRPGGMLVLDDLDWTYASSPTLRGSDWVKGMPADERSEPQVRKVYELLVKTHPSYEAFRTEDGWAFARKRSDSGQAGPRVVTETIVVQSPSFVRRILRKMGG
jgi:predicted O-methyltransferase YrrM